jgi:hypothetical protein
LNLTGAGYIWCIRYVQPGSDISNLELVPRLWNPMEISDLVRYVWCNKLFNEDSGSSSIELDISSDDLNRHFVRRIQEFEVKDALKKMKGGKAMGPDGIPIEVWRSLGDVTIVWPTKLFNLIFQSNKMPDEWRRNILVPIFKNKGDV